MKNICIAGPSRVDLQYVARILYRSGLAQPRPSALDHAMDMAAWHAQAMPEAVDAPLRPGRFWERQASDIFIANIDAPAWGWHDPRSTWLLDFWTEFDPNIFFLLVCVPPWHLLARSLMDTASPPPVSAVMAAWRAHHLELLRFRHRHPQRTLLVDARDCLTHPGALVAACAAGWRLPLAFLDEDTPHDDLPDPLACYLAAQLGRDCGETLGLQRELDATRTSLGSGAEPDLLDQAAVIASYRRLRADTAVSGLLETAQAEIGRLNVENRGLAEQLLQAAGDRDFLEIRLRQTQKELDRQFVDHEETQKRVQKFATRWQRMLERNPGYCDFESVSIEAAPDSEPPAITCRFSNALFAGRHLPECVIDVILEEGMAGLRFVSQPDGVSPLLRWPTGVDGQTLPLVPAGRQDNVLQRLEAFATLGSGDWQLIQVLPRLLAATLGSSPVLDLSHDSRAAFIAGLERFAVSVAVLPSVLRYDRAVLKHEQANADYEYLWIHLDNLTFGARVWPEFEFRLSCAEVRPGRFGAYPKLEFPQLAGQNPFESWYPESEDNLGPKLELRFALPADMDIAVWQRLADVDKQFLSALIGRLPDIVHAAQETGAAIGRAWDDWTRMACDVRRILAARALATA